MDALPTFVSDHDPPPFSVRVGSKVSWHVFVLLPVREPAVRHAICIINDCYVVVRERLDGSVACRRFERKCFDEPCQCLRSLRGGGGQGRQRGSDILDRRPVTLGGRQGVTRATFRLSVFDDPDCSTLVSLLPISCSVIRSSPVPVPTISAQINRHATLRVLVAAWGTTAAPAARARRRRCPDGHQRWGFGGARCSAGRIGSGGPDV